MPKGRRKGKSDRNKNNGSVNTSDDESVENASLFSGYSENHNSADEPNDEVDEVAQQEAFEDKLKEVIDGLTQKSAQGRIDCLHGMGKAFVKKYMPSFVADRWVTITDAIERGLKKGRGSEQEAAADLAPLLFVQLRTEEASDGLMKGLVPVLKIVVDNNSCTALARAKCCTSLGLLTFLAGGEMADVLQQLKQLENVFSGSYLKGDGTVPNVTTDLAILHAAALNAWSLLITLVAPSDVYRMLCNDNDFEPSLKQLEGLLHSSNLDVRLSAGEALATVFELGREYENDFADNFAPELIETLKQLATDSHKYRAKKDRKQQRATFRDVLHYIEDEELPELQVRFGTEVLVLNSWAKRKHYDALCHALGPGINVHLAENELLRDIFQLGNVVINEVITKKRTKLEKHFHNAAAFKARTISRAKNRDKRSDF